MSPIGRAWASDGPEAAMAALNELLRDLTLLARLSKIKLESCLY